MPELKKQYETTARCSYLSMKTGFAMIGELNKDETLYYAQDKTAVPQRHPAIMQNCNDDTKSRDLTDTSLHVVDDLSVFMERSSQKVPKTCLAQASGAPAWRHLVAVWQQDRHCRRQ